MWDFVISPSHWWLLWGAHESVLQTELSEVLVLAHYTQHSSFTSSLPTINIHVLNINIVNNKHLAKTSEILYPLWRRHQVMHNANYWLSENIYWYLKCQGNINLKPDLSGRILTWNLRIQFTKVSNHRLNNKIKLSLCL